jgi:BlaI family transcriptional regulator, penicillinase repressor
MSRASATMCSTTRCRIDMKQLPTDLGDLERDVLELVWQLGDATADQIRQALKRPLKESTVRTVLSRLEQKGFLAHEVEQRTFVYRAATPRADVTSRAVQRIADWFCNGSVDEVLLGMVESKVIDQRDLQRLILKIEKLKAGGK